MQPKCTCLSKLLPILCYHKVSRDPVDGRWLNVDPDRLAAHVRFFQRRNCTFVRAAELASEWPENSVCLTFDDAYESTMTLGVDVLDRMGVKASFYAVSERIGKNSEWDGQRARPLAGLELLRAAAKTGHEIGNHTATHANLAQCDPATQVEEVSTCRDFLDANGLSHGSFCFPYGGTSESAERAVATCGYGIALAIGKRAANSNDNALSLPRIVMAYGDSTAMLLYKLYLKPKLSA